MQIGVPFDQAANMPLDLAIALLNDERLDNTHQIPSKKTSTDVKPSTSKPFKTHGTTYVSTKRRHSNK
ncbi:hypothetical protein [Acinetobacter nectaris]|nr:hypothetical protein [Acinetobacter nectaris]MCF8999296.1 hypothetical protein [Acinetobacter nectaris]MCF9028097.1 hypothetical protein [Acinetobacter nectaris]